MHNSCIMGDFFFLKILMKTNIGGRRREKEGRRWFWSKYTKITVWPGINFNPYKPNSVSSSSFLHHLSPIFSLHLERSYAHQQSSD